MQLVVPMAKLANAQTRREQQTLPYSNPKQERPTSSTFSGQPHLNWLMSPEGRGLLLLLLLLLLAAELGSDAGALSAPDAGAAAAASAGAAAVLALLLCSFARPSAVRKLPAKMLPGADMLAASCKVNRSSSSSSS
jgi:hypothetical protein